MTVLDHWHPVLSSKKLKDQPVGVRLHGRDIVLFRGANGQVGALDDCCPHRRMRLSLGKVVDNRLQCMYHGWTFDGQGQCVAELTEGPDSRLPGKVTIRAYLPEERWGMVWIYIGRGMSEYRTDWSPRRNMA